MPNSPCRGRCQDTCLQFEAAYARPLHSGQQSCTTLHSPIDTWMSAPLHQHSGNHLAAADSFCHRHSAPLSPHVATTPANARLGGGTYTAHVHCQRLAPVERSPCRPSRVMPFRAPAMTWRGPLLCLTRGVRRSGPVPPGRPWGRGWWPMELRDCRLLAGQRHPCDLACCLQGRPGPPLVWLFDCCRHAGLCCQLVCLAFRWLVLPGRPCPRFQ